MWYCFPYCKNTNKLPTASLREAISSFLNIREIFLKHFAARFSSGRLPPARSPAMPGKYAAAGRAARSILLLAGAVHQLQDRPGKDDIAEQRREYNHNVSLFMIVRTGVEAASPKEHLRQSGTARRLRSLFIFSHNKSRRQ